MGFWVRGCLKDRGEKRRKKIGGGVWCPVRTRARRRTRAWVRTRPRAYPRDAYPPARAMRERAFFKIISKKFQKTIEKALTMAAARRIIGVQYDGGKDREGVFQTMKKRSIKKVVAPRGGFYDVVCVHADAERVFRGTSGWTEADCKKAAGRYALVYPSGRAYIIASAAHVYEKGIDAPLSAPSAPNVGGALEEEIRRLSRVDAGDVLYFCTSCGFITTDKAAAEAHRCVEPSRACCACGGAIPLRKRRAGAILCPRCARTQAAALYSYHSRPHRSEPLFTAPDARASRLHIGAEIETECKHGKSEREMAAAFSELLNKDPYRPRAAFESDGSLRNGGVEVITAPMTWSEWTALYDAIKGVYTYTARAHTSEACGVHFHIDAAYFGDAAEAARVKLDFMFNAFFNDFWQPLSGREGTSHYAIPKDFDGAKKSVIRATCCSLIGRGERYCAVNLTGSRTIEVRLFGGGGIDNVDAFFAALDLVQAVARWAKRVSEAAFVRATPRDIVPYLRDVRRVMRYMAAREGAVGVDDERTDFDVFKAACEKITGGDGACA